MRALAGRNIYNLGFRGLGVINTEVWAHAWRCLWPHMPGELNEVRTRSNGLTCSHRAPPELTFFLFPSFPFASFPYLFPFCLSFFPSFFFSFPFLFSSCPFCPVPSSFPCSYLVLPFLSFSSRSFFFACLPFPSFPFISFLFFPSFFFPSFVFAFFLPYCLPFLTLLFSYFMTLTFQQM